MINIYDKDGVFIGSLSELEIDHDNDSVVIVPDNLSGRSKLSLNINQNSNKQLRNFIIEAIINGELDRTSKVKIAELFTSPDSLDREYGKLLATWNDLVSNKST